MLKLFLKLLTDGMKRRRLFHWLPNNMCRKCFMPQAWTSGIQFPEGQRWDTFIFAMGFRPALEPTQSPIQWVMWALTLGSRVAGAWS